MYITTHMKIMDQLSAERCLYVSGVMPANIFHGHHCSEWTAGHEMLSKFHLLCRNYIEKLVIFWMPPSPKQTAL